MTELNETSNDLPADLDISTEVVERLQGIIMSDLGTEDDAAYVLFDRAEEDEGEHKTRTRSMQVDRASCLSFSTSMSDSQR